jgi:hypothetical protein
MYITSTNNYSWLRQFQFFLSFFYYTKHVTHIRTKAMLFLWGGTKSLGTATTSDLLYKPQMINEGDCGAIGGMKIGRGNRSTRRKPAPAPLCSPQIPHDQTRARTRAAAVGSQRLTAWAMARPIRPCYWLSLLKISLSIFMDMFLKQDTAQIC